jgi:hypothetical protein
MHKECNNDKECQNRYNYQRYGTSVLTCSGEFTEDAMKKKAANGGTPTNIIM